MITLIEAKNYRCLQYIRQPLGPFHVLVGPNASGKTTFLDVVAFLGDLVSGGLDEAVGKRTSNFYDLIWGRQGDGFELAVEAAIPDELRTCLRIECSTIRYEVAIKVEETSGELLVNREYLVLRNYPSDGDDRIKRGEFSPDSRSIIASDTTHNVQTILSRNITESDYIVPERDGLEALGTFGFSFRKSMLGILLENEQMFPISTWFKRLLRDGVHPVMLESTTLRDPARPGQGRDLRSDGSNLPSVIETFRTKSLPSYKRWTAHLQTALPDLVDIETVERGEDRHRYIVLCYEGGLRVPSWMTSDGTLRLIALTLIAYLPDIRGVYLIEEPENGIHPQAIDTMFQSLSSVYDAQVLVATHSPVILSMADVNDVLCFSKTAEGAAQIVSGGEHPVLSNWHGETSLGVLFASGVLG